MNPIWKNFLLTYQANLQEDGNVDFPAGHAANGKGIYPLPHLAVLSITGKDASQLLQGQVTCNVNEATESQATLGAMCNPQGRVITTFWLLKTNVGFLLILPKVLLELVRQKLQRYVLRSAVTITDLSDTLCLIGLSLPDAMSAVQFNDDAQNGVISAGLPTVKNRLIAVAETTQAMTAWNHAITQQGFQASGSGAWRYLDFLSGMPWLDEESSEKFIPQMLNLDKLGGISFNKGCYTGQEVVARTHYLGKAKRALFVAECEATNQPSTNAPIFDDTVDPAQSVGHVFATYCHQGKCCMQMVLQISETGAYHLRLADDTPLTFLS